MAAAFVSESVVSHAGVDHGIHRLAVPRLPPFPAVDTMPLPQAILVATVTFKREMQRQLRCPEAVKYPYFYTSLYLTVVRLVLEKHFHVAAADDADDADDDADVDVDDVDDDDDDDDDHAVDENFVNLTVYPRPFPSIDIAHCDMDLAFCLFEFVETWKQLSAVMMAVKDAPGLGAHSLHLHQVYGQHVACVTTSDAHGVVSVHCGSSDV